jgi:hypothetical protein
VCNALHQQCSYDSQCCNRIRFSNTCQCLPDGVGGQCTKNAICYGGICNVASTQCLCASTGVSCLYNIDCCTETCSVNNGITIGICQVGGK